MSRAATAAFGAGCFWGTEKWFRKQFGQALKTTAVGYMGGTTKNPNYEQVCTGRTGHAEVLYLEYDPSKVKYDELVQFFFRMHDPTTKDRQGNDKGTQYRSVIFYYTPEQKEIAERVTHEIQARFKDPIVTTIEPASEFYKAEEYHQQYLEKNPQGYCNHYLRW
jgi:peptide-methionine (S)-S-oxide reductase